LIAKIGRPTTGPHLHFELRTVMPYAPGRGYLPDNPELAGYIAPSAAIWNSRMAVSPGVLWTQPAARDGARGVAVAGEGLIVILGEEYIAGIDTADGGERWRMAIDKDVEKMLLDANSAQIYTANQFGEVTAFALQNPENGAGEAGMQPVWAVDVDAVGIPALMPLPGGGLILSAWDQLAAISAVGELIWEASLETRPSDWLTSGGALIITTAGGQQPLWTVDATGPQRWETEAGGKLAAVENNLLLYSGTTLYRLDLENQSTEPIFALPGGRVDTGDVAALPGGGAIIAHVDRFDRRLIVFDENGNLLWQRSIVEISSGTLDLVVDGDDLFLVVQNPGDRGSEVSLFAIDLAEASLAHLFTGGTRSRAADQTRLFPFGDGRLLISVDGRHLTMLDSGEAGQAVSDEMVSSEQ
jgi:hypothetical protein